MRQYYYLCDKKEDLEKLPDNYDILKTEEVHDTDGILIGLRYYCTPRSKVELKKRLVEEQQSIFSSLAFQMIAPQLTDTQALSVDLLFDNWSENAVNYSSGDRVRYNDVLYRCLQSHTSQPTWTPTDAPSLWAKCLIDPDSPTIPEWEQPDSTNPYSKGDKVTHNGKTWESLIDGNVWEPGVTGTESLWKEVP